MSYLDAILLGVLQGITEFLPISSDGHLVVVQYLLGFTHSLLAFDVFIHVGTLLAVIVYYRKDIAKIAIDVFDKSGGAKSRRLVWLIIVASVPTALIGLGLKDWVEELFTSPIAAALGWLFTGGVLIAADKHSRGEGGVEKMRVIDAVLFGCAQGIAVLPGVSRSGTTVAFGIFRGMSAANAANFSFLMAIPAILGASLLQLDDLRGLPTAEWRVYITGGIVAAAVGYAAIWGLLKLLERRIIKPFGWYCLIAGMVTIVWYSAR